MSTEALQAQALVLAGAVSLPPGEWEAIVAAAAKAQEALRTLDELPLDDQEPVAIYSVTRP